MEKIIVIGEYFTEVAKKFKGWESGENNPLGLALQDEFGLAGSDVEVDIHQTNICLNGKIFTAKHCRRLMEILENYFWNQGEIPFPENKSFRMIFEENNSFIWK